MYDPFLVCALSDHAFCLSGDGWWGDMEEGIGSWHSLLMSDKIYLTEKTCSKHELHLINSFTQNVQLLEVFTLLEQSTLSKEMG